MKNRVIQQGKVVRVKGSSASLFSRGVAAIHPTSSSDTHEGCANPLCRAWVDVRPLDASGGCAPQPGHRVPECELELPDTAIMKLRQRALQMSHGGYGIPIGKSGWIQALALVACIGMLLPIMDAQFGIWLGFLMLIVPGMILILLMARFDLRRRRAKVVREISVWEQAHPGVGL